MKGKTMSFLTVKEAADLLHVSESSVYSMINRKINPLPAYKMGCIRVKKNDLFDWIESTKISTAA